MTLTVVAFTALADSHTLFSICQIHKTVGIMLQLEDFSPVGGGEQNQCPVISVMALFDLSRWANCAVVFCKSNITFISCKQMCRSETSRENVGELVMYKIAPMGLEVEI